ncbi:MAG: 2-oxoacid:acceptor oxidoreductase family protein [Chloroflexi bacterium]|nr:2-oxoacid:acceptor oxidoreductase family protein [Chloroflexota bacterium]
MIETTNLIFAGVGGQGVLLIAELTAQAAVRAGFDVKQTEVHGVSQRGGSVESHVRFGPEVHSPLVMPGQADVVMLGAMSGLVPQVPQEVWLETLSERIPAKHRALNLKAFETGRALSAEG